MAVIFEVQPGSGRSEEYLDIAAELRPILEQIEGFVSVERFQSLSEPSKLLSLSFFKDESALQAWRNNEAHRAAQQLGREGVFDNYRLRIASVDRDYGLLDREQAPMDSKTRHG